MASKKQIVTGIKESVLAAVANGATLEEALAAIQINAGGSRMQMAPDERVNHIQSMTSIDDVRKAIKVAFAKKSKSAGKPETVARYEREIKAGQARLNELMSVLENIGDPVELAKKARELGEDTASIVQRIISAPIMQDGVKDQLKALQTHIKATNADFKALIQGQPQHMPKRLVDIFASIDPEDAGESLITVFETRLGNNDQRLIQLVKGLNLLEGNEISPLPVKSEATAATTGAEGKGARKDDEEPKTMSPEVKAALEQADKTLAEKAEKAMAKAAAKKSNK